MLGIVCIHAFSWTDHVLHGLWALSSPSLVGFVLISAWFGIHFRLNKLFRLLGTVVVCVVVAMMISGMGEGNILKSIKGYWYVWAYVFIMLVSPVVDGFAERCDDRKKLLFAFASVGFLLWAWAPLASVKTFLTPYIPSVLGFGDSSAVILLCIYIEMRIIRRLQWDEWLSNHLVLLLGMFVVSGFAVFVGLRHMFSIFAFCFTLCMLLLLRKVRLGDKFGRFVVLLGPSMFSVYLLHMPFNGYFPEWERIICSTTHLPHGVSQFILAAIVFFACILIDIPRRVAVFLFARGVDFLRTCK